jgi:hypothetical protein
MTALYSQQFDRAMYHFEVANNRSFFSEAFWEIRNEWIQANLGIVLGIAIFLIFSFSLFSKFDKKKRFQRLKINTGEFIRSRPILGSIFYSFHVSRHPVDGFFDLKYAGIVKRPYLGASILYLLLFASFIFFNVAQGFIYQQQAAIELDFVAMTIGFFVILFLFIYTNYLSSSIQEGEAGLKDIFLIPAYSSVPAIFALIGVTLLSHFLTENEAFFLTFGLMLGLCWSIINLLMGLTQMHGFLFRDTVKNLFVTFIFMALVGFVLVILSVMFDQAGMFVLEVAGEVWRNVTRSF